jgi:uncharacterized ferritin-like protein (DUF455 family)
VQNANRCGSGILRRKKLNNIFAAAYAVLTASDPQDKITLTNTYAREVASGSMTIMPWQDPELINEPGRPVRPKLVASKAVPQRKLNTLQGCAAFIHAITHIEFNAINLAWDAVYRFRDMPDAFYHDWAQIAKEEADHFQLLRNHLHTLGYDYGDFNAHNGLWEMAKRTSHDVLVRMALVPRVLEARGLDVTPAMIKRLHNAGDERAVQILETILRDEIGHVQTGTRWFDFLCERRGLNREVTFFNLLADYMQGGIRGPFHREARLKAGFNEKELQFLENVVAGV